MKKQLPPVQFITELLRGWRQLLASVADIGHYRPMDIDSVAAALRADFVRLPILRFLNLDSICTYTAQPRFFRWAQLFCNKCEKQNDCSLLAATAKTMPVFEQYCSNAAKFRRRLETLRQGMA